MDTIKLFIFLLAFFVCSTSFGDNTYSVVGKLKTKDYVVLLKNGPNGPAYSITNHEGTEVADNLTGDQLSSRFPDIKNLLERGIADDAGLSPGFKELYERKTYDLN